MFTGENWQEGKIRFGFVLWYGEYSTQENNNLHLFSIWGKFDHYSHFFRWANVEFRSLPSRKEENSEAAGSADDGTCLTLQPSSRPSPVPPRRRAAPQVSEAAVHRLCGRQRGEVAFDLWCTTRLVQGGAVRGSQAGVMRIPSVSEGLQMCSTPHAMFIIHYSIRTSLSSEKDQG